MSARFATNFIVLLVGAGLVTVIFAGLHANLPIVATIIRLPPLNAMALSGIGFGSLLAFFAFIGFDAVSTAVTSAEQAASLLRTDVSGVFMATSETKSTIASDGSHLEIAG